VYFCRGYLKWKDMATITLEYNPQTKGALEFVNRIKESGYFTIKTPSLQ
jgi:hypothetical protein